MPTSQTTAPLASSAVSPPLRLGVRAGGVVLVLVFCLTLLCAIGIASCFRLSSAPQALRRSVMESVPGQWDKRFAVNVGGFTLGFVRFGSHFFNLPPEPKAALEALRGAEVGVYKLRNPPPALDYSAVFKAADETMRRRGWERIVGSRRAGSWWRCICPGGFARSNARRAASSSSTRRIWWSCPLAATWSPCSSWREFRSTFSPRKNQGRRM